jgi:hypothetical protein
MTLKRIILLIIAAAGFFTACSEWTDTESVQVEEQYINTQNPDLYQQYLESLRNYKKSYHQLLIGWFDNSDKAYNSRGMHIESVPDKTDILVLMSADDLTASELSEMASLREDKGTKILYDIDCEDFRVSIELQNAEITTQNELAKAEAETTGEEYTPVPLLVFAEKLPAFVEQQLALFDKYNYDGFNLRYDGKSAVVMTGAEKAELQNIQNIIFNSVLAAINAHPDKVYIFAGRPDHVLDKGILQKFNYILIRTHEEVSVGRVTEIVKTSLVADVPADNILVFTAPYFIDEYDVEWGNITTPEGTTIRAIPEIARWVMTPDSFTKAGMAIYRMNLDYYYPEEDYKYVREAIDIMNPSPKN